MIKCTVCGGSLIKGMGNPCSCASTGTGKKPEVISKSVQRRLAVQNKTKEQEKFESFCLEYNLEWDFESKDGYYKDWKTKQAFAVYKYSDCRGIK